LVYDQASSGTHDDETGDTGAGAGEGATGAGEGAGVTVQLGVPLSGVVPQTHPIGGYPFAFS
jgi:hypothetical protein